VLAFPQIIAQLIADGHHVHTGAMRALLNAKSVEGVCLVSDSAPFAGLPAGQYEWEGYTVILDGHTCRTPEGNLAGAYALIDTGFRTLIHSLGLTPSEASICSSEVPARVLGLPPLPKGERLGVRAKGRLLPGCDADVVVVDGEFRVEMTIVGGEIFYQ
jgi:N-acetylglucosamine-6-phosphate deacetylase